MADAPEYLIEIDALDENDAPVTVRLSSSGYVTGPNDDPPNTIYDAAIDASGPGDFSQALYGEGQTIGTSEVGYGSVPLSNADGFYDKIKNYAVDGRPLVIKRLPNRRSPYSEAEVILRATLETIESDSAYVVMRIRVYDRRLDLDKPIQENKYGGTTNSGGATADGTVDYRDQVKPLVYGRVFNIEPIPVNPFDLIYQVNDGAVDGIFVYDGGVPLNVGSNFTTISALQSATIAPGSFATARSLGLFRLGWAPSKTITADVVEGATAADRRAGAIALRIMSRLGITGIDTTSFASLDAAAPYEVGIWIDRETSALRALTDIMSSVGAYLIPNADNEFKAGRLAFGSPSQVINEHDMITEGAQSTVRFFLNPDTPNNLPTHRVEIEYRRVWNTQTDSDLHGCVDVDFRGFVAKEYRDVSSEDSAVRTRHPLSEEMQVRTLLTQLSDAQAEATRLRSLYGVNREVITFNMDATEAPALGQTVTIQLPRLGYENGRDMIVIGRREIFSRYQTQITCWG